MPLFGWVDLSFIVCWTALIGILIWTLIYLFLKRPIIYLIPASVVLIGMSYSYWLEHEWNEREASPVVFMSHYDGDINGITLYLRENGSYKLMDYSLLGGSDYFGTYRLRGDTILLNNANPLGKNRDIISPALLIDTNQVLPKQGTDGSFDRNQLFRMRIVKNHLTKVNSLKEWQKQN